MNMYGLDPGIYDFGFSDPTIIGSLSRPSRYLYATTGITADADDDAPPVVPKKPTSPPRHRHDGTSPLPFGMDWSPPPRKWDGRDSKWPHDPLSGWSYCVTVPSWITLPKSRGSDHVVVIIGLCVCLTMATVLIFCIAACYVVNNTRDI
ncbi:hypothetical protein U1Q18_006759 [Sarracenia purpurea var. burkii]